MFLNPPSVITTIVRTLTRNSPRNQNTRSSVYRPHFARGKLTIYGGVISCVVSCAFGSLVVNGGAGRRIYMLRPERTQAEPRPRAGSSATNIFQIQNRSDIRPPANIHSQQPERRGAEDSELGGNKHPRMSASTTPLRAWRHNRRSANRRHNRSPASHVLSASDHPG